MSSIIYINLNTIPIVSITSWSVVVATCDVLYCTMCR